MKFTIIIPTYKRPGRLAQCLDSLQNLDYADWEVIVVNDGGDDSFQNLPPKLTQDLPLRLMDVPHGGPAKARNHGARAATGDILAFTDDDCRVTPDWLSQFAAEFHRAPAVAGLGGSWLNPHPDNIPALTAQLYMDFLRQQFTDINGNAWLIPSNNVAYRREVFASLGGFDERYPLAAAEDMDLCYRVVLAGYAQKHLWEAQIWHDHRLSYSAFLAQQFRYGRGAYYFEQIWGPGPATMAELLPHQPKRFYNNLLRYLWRKRADWRVWLLLGLTPLAHRRGKAWESQHRA